MDEEKPILAASQNVALSSANEAIGGLVDIFGGALRSALSTSPDERSNSAPLKDSVASTIRDCGSSLLQFVSGMELPHSIEELIHLPNFSALTEKFAFLDKLDVFEITQERFNELMEGVAE